jgi:hypothetical protein
MEAVFIYLVLKMGFGFLNGYFLVMNLVHTVIAIFTGYATTQNMAQYTVRSHISYITLTGVVVFKAPVV